ncbi:MAG: alpha-glucan family phosphorylase [Parabacteroides merdae]
MCRLGLSTEWKRFFAEHFDKKFFKDQSNKKYWEAIQNVADEEIWSIRKTLKNKLITYIKNQYKTNWLKNQGDPAKVVSILDKINPNALLIGFGRRFATYKRAHLLFTDLDRLAKIVNNEQYPIQFVFTGKAHPADGGGQGLIKHIVEISRRPEFLGKIIFLENYDMRLARHLIAGVDVWLNTPTRPLEASGHPAKSRDERCPELPVLDGWWYEGYKQGAGWALTDKRTYENQQYQDQLDAATIYHILETEIIPDLPCKKQQGLLSRMDPVHQEFDVRNRSRLYDERMLDDYIDRFYNKLATRSAHLHENGFAEAKAIAAWKEEVAEHWDSFQVESFTCSQDLAIDGPVVGKEYNFNLVIDRHELKGMLGVEMVVTKENPDNHQLELLATEQFKLIKEEGSNCSSN